MKSRYDIGYGPADTDAPPPLLDDCRACEAAFCYIPPVPPVKYVAPDPWDTTEDGHCPFCDIDFTSSRNPRRSAESHARAKFRAGDKTHRPPVRKE